MSEAMVLHITMHDQCANVQFSRNKRIGDLDLRSHRQVANADHDAAQCGNTSCVHKRTHIPTCLESLMPCGIGPQQDTIYCLQSLARSVP